MQLSKSGAIQLSSSDSRKMAHSKSLRGKESSTFTQSLREAAKENIQDRKRDKLNDFARHLVMKIESTLQPTKIALKDKKSGTPKHSRNSTALSQPYQKQASGATLEKKTTAATTSKGGTNLRTLTSIYTNNTHESQMQQQQQHSSRGEGSQGLGASIVFQMKSANQTGGGFSQSQGAKTGGDSSTPVSRKAADLLFKNGVKIAKKSNRIVQKLIRGHQGRVAKRGTSAKREGGGSRNEHTFESEKEDGPSSMNQTHVSNKRGKERKVPVLVELSQFSAGKKILLPLSSTSRGKEE